MLTRREMFLSCETTGGRLLASGPLPLPCLQSCEGIASTLDVCAGCTAPRRLLRLPAWLVRLPLLRKAYRPVVFSRPSSRLFRPQYLRCGVSAFSLYRLRVLMVTHKRLQEIAALELACHSMLKVLWSRERQT